MLRLFKLSLMLVINLDYMFQNHSLFTI